MLIKLDLKYGDRIFVKGVALRGVIDNYIVEFVDGKTRTTFENSVQKGVEYKSLVLPEVCLTRSTP